MTQYFETWRGQDLLSKQSSTSDSCEFPSFSTLFFQAALGLCMMGSPHTTMACWSGLMPLLFSVFVGAFVPATRLAPSTSADAGLPLRYRDVSSTCGGYTSYYSCPISLGSGCCTQDFICATDDECVMTSTFTATSVSSVCDAGWTGCAAGQGGKHMLPYR